MNGPNRAAAARAYCPSDKKWVSEYGLKLLRSSHGYRVGLNEFNDVCDELGRCAIIECEHNRLAWWRLRVEMLVRPVTAALLQSLKQFVLRSSGRKR